MQWEPSCSSEEFSCSHLKHNPTVLRTGLGTPRVTHALVLSASSGGGRWTQTLPAFWPSSVGWGRCGSGDKNMHWLVRFFFFLFSFSSVHCKLESLGKRDTLLGIYSHSSGLRDSFRLMMGMEGTNPTAGGATPGQV